MIERSPAVKNSIHQKAEQNRAHAFCSHLYFTHQITASSNSYKVFEGYLLTLAVSSGFFALKRHLMCTRRGGVTLVT